MRGQKVCVTVTVTVRGRVGAVVLVPCVIGRSFEIERVAVRVGAGCFRGYLSEDSLAGGGEWGGAPRRGLENRGYT